MLETPNVRDSDIFPIFVVPVGDDGKRKAFHIVHCLAQPACDATLRISPGKQHRLPPECIAKFAAQKGWLADRKGYALCPDHKPGRKPSDMPPHQRRAAFIAIRDRDLEAAAARMLKPCEPVGAMAQKAAAVRASVVQTESNIGPYREAARAAGLTELAVEMVAFVYKHPARIWSSRREAARAGGFNVWTFHGAMSRAIAAGLIVQEPVSGRLSRPFRFRMVDQFDPPAMQPDQSEDSAMPETEPVVVTVQPPKAEPPRQPTREHNRRIRDALDSAYDDVGGCYWKDGSDAKVAENLRLPRAWVTTLRESLYGPDENEALRARVGLASTLEVDAAKLKNDALALATRAEELERQARKLLGKD